MTILDVNTQQQIIDLLTPLMASEQERRSLLIQAFSDHPLLRQIDYSGPTSAFLPILIHKLNQFGIVEDGRHALWVLLEVARGEVGVDRQQSIDALRPVFAPPLRLAVDSVPGFAQPMVAQYLSLMLPRECDKWFRSNRRFDFHPQYQWVPVGGNWLDNSPVDDLVNDLIQRLRIGETRFALVGNYGQGKTFLAWALALRLALEEQPTHIPLFFPLKSYSRTSEEPVLGPISRYFQERYGLDVERLLASRPCLMILDGLDEMPIGMKSVVQPLTEIIRKLNDIQPLAVLVTTRPGVFGGTVDSYATDLPQFKIAILRNWDSLVHWELLLKKCEQTGYAAFRSGWEQFRDQVSKRRLHDLTSRPLWCRMIIEYRDRVLDEDIASESDLYAFYVNEFLKENESKSEMQQLLTMKEKLVAMECLAENMVIGGSQSLDDDEIRSILSTTFGEIPISKLNEYLLRDLRTYTLLNTENHKNYILYSFGHLSFRDFFVACRVVRFLETETPELSQIVGLPLMQQIVKKSDMYQFILGLLRSHPRACYGISQFLRSKTPSYSINSAELDRKIRHQILDLWLSYARTILNKPADLVGFRLDELDLGQTDLSYCNFQGAYVNDTIFTESNLTGANFTDAKCRGADFSGSVITDVDFTGADLRGAAGLKF